MGIGWKSKRWLRERMVSRSLYGSVVASTKWTWSGGSSRVLRRALPAALDSMCASSRMKTRFDPAWEATVVTDTRMSRMSSTELWLAASSSITSSDEPSMIEVQLSHSLQGDPSEWRFSQLRALARIRAEVV